MADPSEEDRVQAARAAREAGLERLLQMDPEQVTRAWLLARGYAERLRRPDAPQAEPAHVYHPRQGR